MMQILAESIARTARHAAEQRALTPQAHLAAVDAYARYVHYLDFLAKSVAVPPTAIIVKVEGVKIKMPSVDALADWLVERMYK